MVSVWRNVRCGSVSGFLEKKKGFAKVAGHSNHRCEEVPAHAIVVQVGLSEEELNLPLRSTSPNQNRAIIVEFPHFFLAMFFDASRRLVCALCDFLEGQAPSLPFAIAVQILTGVVDSERLGDLLVV